MTPPSEPATVPRRRSSGPDADRVAEPSVEPRLLVDAALAVIREQGARNLTVDAVLSRAALGTRAFYRHFTSKDHLIVAVFARAADQEAARLRGRMEPAHDPLGAIVAWIECRLDLAFDPKVASDLRYLSEQAQAVYGTAPQAIDLAFATMLAPLIEQLERWCARGRGRSSDAGATADAIHSVVWGAVQRHWAHGDNEHAAVRAQVVTFCLRAIGASEPQIVGAVAPRRLLRRERN